MSKLDDILANYKPKFTPPKEIPPCDRCGKEHNLFTARLGTKTLCEDCFTLEYDERKSLSKPYQLKLA